MLKIPLETRGKPRATRPDEWGIWFDAGGADLLIWDEYPLEQSNKGAYLDNSAISDQRGNGR